MAINFFSFSKLSVVDTKKHPVARHLDWNNRVCGSALTRLAREKKRVNKVNVATIFDVDKFVNPVNYIEFKVLDKLKDLPKVMSLDHAAVFVNEVPGQKVRYQLRRVLNFEPQFYKDCYVPKIVDTPQLILDGAVVDDKFRKKTQKMVWELKDKKYFYWENMPEALSTYLEPVKELVKRRIPYHERPERSMSELTRRKIRRKFDSWYYRELAKVKGNAERVNFKFITFTVTTPHFDHETTFKAWNNFLQHWKKLNYGKLPDGTEKLKYLWVAEVQDGKRNIEIANKYYKLYREGGDRAAEYLEKYQHYSSIIPTNNVHFHIVVDKFYNMELVNHLWLTALGNLGAKTHNEQGVKYNPAQMSWRGCGKCSCCEKKDFKSCATKNYNITYNGVARYISKYVTKNTGGIKGQLWNCSKTVSSLATSLSNCIDLGDLRGSLTLC